MSTVAWEEMSIKEIEKYLQGVKASETLIAELRKDRRKGVKRLAERLKRELLKEQQLEEHWLKLNQKETNLRSEGYRFIAGIDEAGRGPLAGPVAAAAVILPEGVKITGLDDSKKLSEGERERLFEEIKKKAVSYGVGFADNQEIDNLNILKATFKAMERAINRLNRRPDYILIDGDKILPGVEIYQEAVVGGDSRVNAIAAASILAKVSRDRLLKEYHQRYPQYDFIHNKGYGTGEHIKALKKHGPTPWHRFSFNIVRESAFLHYKTEISRTQSAEILDLLGQKIAVQGVFSEENLEFLRKLYRERQQTLLES